MAEENKEIKKVRFKFRLGKYNYSNDLKKAELTLKEVEKLFETRSAVFYALVSASAILMFMVFRFQILLAMHDYVLIFAISFITTYYAILSYEKGKMPFKGKLVTLATVSSDKLYAFTKAASEALADGKITPEEFAKILAVILQYKK